MSREQNERVEEAIAGSQLRNDKYRAQCCFCEDEGHVDRKTSLVVDATTGWWECFRCGERGRLQDGFADAMLRERSARKPRDASQRWEPPPFFQELGEPSGEFLLRPAIKYLASRGVTRKAIRMLHIGACSDGPWRGRVIVPHLDVDGETWLGWVGRVWVKRPRPGVLPYRYPRGMRRTLFNARVLQIESDEPALGFEGALDVAHYPERAFAFFGSPTPAHVEEIKQRARRPVAIVLDGDVPDKNEMLGLRLRFDGLRAGSVRLAPRQDPDEVPRAWLLEQARRCVL